MMQHSNLDNQLSGSSSFATPPSQSLGGSHQWNSIGLILNTDQFSLDATEVLPTTQTPNSSMVQDLGLQWPYSTEDYTHHSPHQVNFLENNIKEEPPGSLINFISRGKEPSDSSHQYQPLPCLDNLIKQEPLLNNQYSPAGFHTTASYGGFLPTTTGAGTPSFTSLLSNGGGFHGVNFLSPVGSNLSLSREIGGFGTHEPLQSQRDQRSSLVRGTKRSSSTASSSTVGSASPPPPPPPPPPSMAKKPRTESRSPISPFKVRKEKLGDRIAALQQLVAPFGKTDTASVLMEAIGYIKFLQEQVQKLSVPYMKSSSGNRQGTSHGVAGGEKDEESRQGLRSRGLCLVPLACTSYVTSEDLGIWPSQNPRGGF